MGKEMAKREDLTGQRFGKLLVLGQEEKTEETKERYKLWRCRCDCGREIVTDTRRLKRGVVRDCGCEPKADARQGRRAEDLTGRTYGHLTVLKRAQNRGGRTCWLCRCDCGREKEVTARDLKAGKVTSCGCHAYDKIHNWVDLTGRRFGRLTALEPTSRRSGKGSIYWRCRCDCGRETEVAADALVQGNCLSCGCLKRQRQQEIKQYLHRVDGTCIEILEKRKYRRDNTSGFRGVYHTKNGKYKACIGFKQTRYWLGTFGTFDEAVQARVAAEQVLYEGFLKAWHQWKEHADRDPAWARENPLTFDVEKVGGEFVIRQE